MRGRQGRRGKDEGNIWCSEKFKHQGSGLFIGTLVSLGLHEKFCLVNCRSFKNSVPDLNFCCFALKDCFQEFRKNVHDWKLKGVCNWETAGSELGDANYVLSCLFQKVFH